MPFEIERREHDGVVILAPHGRLMIGEPVETFRNMLDALYAEGRTQVVLDFSDVDYIDSSALGCLVVAHTKFHKAGGVMPMFGLNRRTIELLVITKLATVFRIAESEIEAVNLCFPDRESKPFDILNFVEEQRARKKGGVRE